MQGLLSWVGFIRTLAGAFLGLSLVSATARASIVLHETRDSPYDLEVSGHLKGVKLGEKRFVRWKELRALPTTKLILSGEFIPGEQEVTALFLADLLPQLGAKRDVDAVVAPCVDGYASIYRTDFITANRPFFVLEINGKGPDTWPPAGLKFNPGPYVITVAESVVPGVATILDVGHKRPWGVNALKLVHYDDEFKTVLTGKWKSLSAKAVQGREIWMNSCFSCHRGPADSFGGNKSERPFEVLAAHAGYNKEYFKKYVRNPTGVMPGAKMEAHPHYTDPQLDALMAFITAEAK